MNSISQALKVFFLHILVVGVVFSALSSPAYADWVLVGPNGEYRSTNIPGAGSQAEEDAEAATGCRINHMGRGELDLSAGCSETRNVAPDLSLEEEIQERALAEETREGKPLSLIVYDYSMGTTGGSCLSCDFLSYFMIALSDFSFSVYQFFYDAFLALVPLTLMIWLGYRVAKLMVTGGEDGKGFLYSVIGKVALFVMVWLIALGANSNQKYLWDLSGPIFLDFSFSLSNIVRTTALENTGVATVDTNGPLFCNNVDTPMTDSQASGATEYPFVDPAMRLGCTTERVHFMGVASGIAILLSEKGGGLSVTDFGSWGFYLLNLFVSLVLGIFIIVTFSLSAVWLIFLILDVVVRAMITAAFAPIILTMFLYQPLRGIAVNAMKMLVASAVTALAIGLVGILAFVLITNTVNVYNATFSDVNSAYSNFNLTTPVSTNTNDPTVQMREFLDRIETGTKDENMGIPLDLGTPWFWYLAFSGIAIFALGRKIIAMLEQAVGGSGMSAMADRAVSMTRAGSKMAVIGATAGTAIIGGAGLLTASRVGAPIAAYAGGAARQGGRDAIAGALKNSNPERRRQILAGVSGLKTGASFAKNAGGGAAQGAKVGGKAFAQNAMQGGAARVNNPGDEDQQ